MPPEFASLDLAASLGAEQRVSWLAEFDAGMLAMVIRGAIDAAAEHLTRDPHVDPHAYGRELAETVERRILKRDT